MGDPNTLEEIEADLRFCEELLNGSGNAKSCLLQRPCSAAAAVVQSPEKQGLTPNRQPAAAMHPASAPPAARTTEELLTMLTSVPEGQPFEIDTRLLYSPQSSRSDVASHETESHSSPASTRGGSLSGGLHVTFAQQLSGQKIGAVEFNSHDGGHPCRSQQHAAGPALGIQGQAQTRPGSGRHSSRPSQPSQAGSQGRPGSAPLRDGGGGASSRPARQLLLDDFEGRGVQGRTAELLRIGREDRLRQLSQPRTQLWQRCAEIRVREEQEQLQECTFAPKTGRPPTQHRLAPGVPVEERLQLAAAGRQEALERARVEKEKETLADCTFAPRLVTQPDHLLQGEYTPLHRRLGEEARRRSVRLSQARLQHGLPDADLTFQPQLNPRSLKMAAEKESRELFQQPGSTQRRPGSAPRGGASPGSDDFTFSPAINPTSERLLEDSSTVPTDFQERLRYYSVRRQAKERAASAAADADACTFRPDTGNAVQVLALSARRAGNLLETEEERYDRLARDEAERLAARRAAKEAEVYGGLEFKPRLNPRSLVLAPAGSGGLEALASAEKKQRRLAELQRAEEERRRAECTFQPNTSKPRVRGYGDEFQPPAANAVISIAAAAKQGFEGLTQRIADYQAEREARAAAVKAEEEAKQLGECSFAPSINRQRVQAKGPVVVRGLERVQELKQLAERQRAEAEERAARVFHLNPRAKLGPTVPKPFQLAGHALLEAKAAEKQTALLQGTLERRARDCPFRPKTNHQRRQEQLNRILAQPLLDDSEFAGAYRL